MKQKPYHYTMARIRGHLEFNNYRVARERVGVRPVFLSLFAFLIVFVLPGSLSAQVACDPGESAVTLYKSYAIDYTYSYQTINPQNTIGYPDDKFAQLRAGNFPQFLGSMDIQFNDVVPQGDTIWLRTASATYTGVSDYRVSSSLNGVSFSYAVDYATPLPGQIFRDAFYVVSNPFGVQYLRIQCIDNNQGLRIESISYKRRACNTYCGFESIEYMSTTGLAVTPSSTAQDTMLALGTPDGLGAMLNGDNDHYLILDLGDTIPYGSYVQLFLARDTAEVPMRVTGSLNGSTFTNPVTYYPENENPLFRQYLYQVDQINGVRYVQVAVLLDHTIGYVDAVIADFPTLFGRNVISGYVYNDGNSNGIRNVAEVGEAGIELTLYRDVNGDNTLNTGDIAIDTTTTSVSGGYLFETYSLHMDYLVVVNPQTLPDNTVLTIDAIQPLVFSQFNEGACLDLSYEFCTGSCPPEAYNDYAEISMGVPVEVSVLDNDRGDIDTTSVSVTGLQEPAHGEVSVGAGGIITYTPDANYAGPDAFEYEVCADFPPYECATATVYVNITCSVIPGQNTIFGIIFDDQNQNGYFNAGETWGFADTITVDLYDDANGNGSVDGGESVVATTTTDASGYYQFDLANSAADYVVQVRTASVPSGAAFTTQSHFAVEFTGGEEAFCGQNIGLAFCAPNCPTIAVDDEATASQGSAVYLDVVSNDLDFDGDIDLASLDLVTKPANGNIIIGNDGNFIYSPNGSFSGVDEFEYVICDGQSPTPSCDTATVTITVEEDFINPCAEAVREHTYYLPYPEEELRTALINSASGSCGDLIAGVARSVTTIKSPYPGIEIHFDHWEDGYEGDITNPVQSTTQVWGDGNLDNGVAPGYPSDIIPAGGNIVLDNNLLWNPRNPATIAFDGKDKLYTSGDIALSRIVGDVDQFHVQAAKTDVYDINRFGTSFTVPFGENLGVEFQYTALFIRAGEDGAQVSVDTDNDGLVEDYAVLGEGEVLFVDGGVFEGATITSSDPVGVDILFGGLDCFGTRQISILPAEFYDDTYYTPVPTRLGSAPSAVYLYNSLPTSMTITWYSNANSGSFAIPATSSYRFELDDNSGYRFTNLSGESFTAMQVVDSDGDGDDYDWAFNLISASRLTEFASIAWAPGSRDGSRNYNPVWVTPTANTTLYIKYDGNMVDESSMESPCGVPYDESVTLDELDYYRVFDDSDNDQSGLAVYTCDGTLIVAVYGEDPGAGSPTPTADPALDVGTTIQPMCLQALILATNDKAVSPPDDYVIIDVLGNDYGFLATIDTSSVSTYGLLQPANGSITIEANGEITYTPDPGFEGEDVFEYSVCSVEDPFLCDIATVYVTVSPCVATADENLINGYVYLELLPDDGIYYDEERMPGFLVSLYGDSDCDGEIDPGERLIATTVTNASGAYSFSTINGQYVKDDFDYDTGLGGGNDGSITWDNDWQEVGTSGGFGSSPVYIDYDAVTGDTALIINGSSRGASRDVTFSDMSQVFLKFDYRRQSMENDGEALNVQVNGHTVYIINDGNGVENDAYPTEVELEVPLMLINQGSANTVSFITNSSTSSSDYFYIDDVEFIFTTESSVCFITQVDVSDKNNAYEVAALNSDTASFTGLGSCANDKYLGVLAKVIANDDYDVCGIDASVTIDILFNDIGETDPLTVTTSGLAQPANGAVTINLDGSVRYQPDPGYEGVDSFQYRVYSEEDPVVSDIAWVYLNVSCAIVDGSNSITGAIFNDYNGNGIYDVGEGSLSGIRLFLYRDENGNGVVDGAEGAEAMDTTYTEDGTYSFIMPAPEVNTTVILRVERGVDDADEDYRGRRISLDRSNLRLNSTYPYAGMRFTGVDVPQNAVIVDAEISFWAYGTNTGSCNMAISVEDDDLAPAFSTSRDDISDRWDGSNTVSWSGVPNWYNGNEYSTPDLSSIIQNVVNRSDWNPGDNLAFIFRRYSGSRSMRSNEYGSSEEFAPVLELTYGTSEYPIDYLVVIDTTSIPSGGFMTTDIVEGAHFNVPSESDCRNNFGIRFNTANAIDDINVTLQNYPVSGEVMTNDFDNEGDAIDFGSFLDQFGTGLPIPSGAVVSGTDREGNPVISAGVLAFSASGSYTFTPDSSFVGIVEVDYAICDDGVVTVCDTATLTIHVTPFTNPNDLSSNSITLQNDNVRVYEPYERNGDVLANDMDPELDDITLQGYEYDSDGDGVPDQSRDLSTEGFVGGVDRFGEPVTKAGSFILYPDGFYQFTPEPDFYGTVVIEYEVCDDAPPPYQACARASLTFEVIKPEYGTDNLPPFAGDDYASTPINHPVTAWWAANDADTDGDFIQLKGTSVFVETDNLGTGDTLGTYVTEQGGTITFMDNGLFGYQPPLNHIGPDRYKYSICDSSDAPACDSATIYLNVTPIRFDYGDLGVQYEAAEHMIPLDANDDGIPDLPGSVWLGQIVDAEVGRIPSYDADGDNNNGSNDEQGVVFPTMINAGSPAKFGIVVNGTDPGMEVHYGFWIDWDIDGDFDDFYKGMGYTVDEFNRNRDTIAQWISVPETLPSTVIYIRVRAMPTEPTSLDYGVAMRNGEAEDYRWDFSELLPVELTYFQAEAQENDALLTWHTASELNNDFFSVQRSTDGAVWQVIGMVEGHGTTADPHDYSFLDEDLAPGLYYYRLQQYDYDGASEFSPVRSVRIEGDGPATAAYRMSVFPNPVPTCGSVRVDGLPDGEVRIILMSLNGGTVAELELPAGMRDLELEKYDLTRGFYVIVAEQNGVIYQQKILLMD